MPLPDWSIEPDWDLLILGGTAIPGRTKLDYTGDSGLDIQKPKFGVGATITDEGTPPQLFEAETVLANIDQLIEFQKVIPMLKPVAKGRARDPLEIIHPQAELWKVNVITVGKISAPSPVGGGSYTVTYSLHEWAPPVTVKKPKKKPQSSDREDWDVQKQIDRLKPSSRATP